MQRVYTSGILVNPDLSNLRVIIILHLYGLYIS